ncbi:unnamed protein product, partial [Ectocarpus sp. 12 AP-2014]
SSCCTETFILCARCLIGVRLRKHSPLLAFCVEYWLKHVVCTRKVQLFVPLSRRAHLSRKIVHLAFTEREPRQTVSRLEPCARRCRCGTAATAVNAMFWRSVPSVPWAGPSPRGSNNGAGDAGGDGGRHAKGGGNARRKQQAPEPYSLGHLRVLFQRLIDAQEGKVEGETTVVETLRAISEVVVYGENQDAKLAARAAA